MAGKPNNMLSTTKNIYGSQRSISYIDCIYDGHRKIEKIETDNKCANCKFQINN